MRIIKSIIIPDGVKTIEVSAFRSNEIYSLVLSKNLKRNTFPKNIGKPCRVFSSIHQVSFCYHSKNIVKNNRESCFSSKASYILW